MNDKDLLRYSRQIMLPEVDVEGQEKLLGAKVFIIGLGGLGSPVSMYLAAAGVGHLVLADYDQVDLSNLLRQIVHTTNHIAEQKVDSAEAMLKQLNPEIEISKIKQKLRNEGLSEQIAKADVVVDCTDNFSTRFAINQYCVEHKVPLVSGAAIRLEGQISVFDSRDDESPCYRCLYQEVDDENLSCAQSGVLSPVVGVIGSMQATEAMKLIIGFGETLVGRLQLFDAKSMTWREFKLNKDENCPVCGAI